MGHSKRGEKLLCRGHAMRGRHVCYHHGGKSLRGAASPSFKHGAFSKSVPERLAAIAQSELEHPDAGTNKREIALMAARADELLGQLSRGGSWQAWKAVVAAIPKLKKAFYAGDVQGCAAAIRELEAAAEDGGKDRMTWDELLATWDKRREAIESDNRNAYRRSMALSVEEMRTVIGALLATMREFITDREQLAEFGRRLEQRVPLAYLPEPRRQSVIEARGGAVDEAREAELGS